MCVMISYVLIHSQPQRWIPNFLLTPHPARIHSGKETGYDMIQKITHKTTCQYQLELGGVSVKLYS